MKSIKRPCWGRGLGSRTGPPPSARPSSLWKRVDCPGHWRLKSSGLDFRRGAPALAATESTNNSKDKCHYEGSLIVCGSLTILDTWHAWSHLAFMILWHITKNAITGIFQYYEALILANIQLSSIKSVFQVAIMKDQKKKSPKSCLF